MDANGEPEKTPTEAERVSDRELVVTRTFNAPARIVFKAWTTPALFQRWWVPKSFGITLLSCEMDIRTGGSYRLVMKHPAFEQPMPFFGRYIEVTPHTRIVWSNDEGGEGGQITTVTFAERDGGTLVVMRDTYRSKKALDEAIASGATSGGFDETFNQLEEVLGGMVSGS